MSAPMFKELRRAYGFDEIAIVPGEVTINPNMSATNFTIGDHQFSIPIMASAMDAVVSPAFADSDGPSGRAGRPQFRGHIHTL